METAKDNFIFEMFIISPITEIIAKLENREYRDCDIEWLNDRLKKYTVLALEVLGKKINLGEAIGGPMNYDNRSRFLSYFKTLLSFFKGI